MNNLNRSFHISTKNSPLIFAHMYPNMMTNKTPDDFNSKAFKELAMMTDSAFSMVGNIIVKKANNIKGLFKDSLLVLTSEIE